MLFNWFDYNLNKSYVNTQKRLGIVEVVKRIEELRILKGWSIYRLSMETGLTQQAIHAWYNPNKKTVPSIATLETICESFGISMAEFFTEKYTVEMTPQIKTIYDNWCALPNEERQLIDSLVKKLINHK